MEVTSFITKVKANQNSVFLGFKIVISVLVLVYLYFTFEKQEEVFGYAADSLKFKLLDNEVYEIWICLLLMPINWLLEAWKWMFLASKVERVKFIDALKGTLAGLGLGFITPQAIGDYAARLYFLDFHNKIETIGAVLLGRVTMFCVSIFYGIVGFCILDYFQVLGNSRFLSPTVIWGIAIFSILGILSLYILNFQKFFPKKFIENKWVEKIWLSMKVFQAYTLSEIFLCISLSIMRYVVFTVQYLLLLKFFGVDIYNVLIISAIWMVYFVKSVFPSFNFMNDLGVREVSAVFFFTKLGINSEIAVLASLMLWLINIFIPTIVGVAILLLSKSKL